MDWDDLRIFLAVVRAESLSGAGRGLKIDPATVGRRVARLEESVGARLFTKTPQGYALTEAGTRPSVTSIAVSIIDRVKPLTPKP